MAPRPRAAILGMVASRPFGQALRLLESVDHGAANVLGVLTYHRIGDREGVAGAPSVVSATPAELDAQLTALRRRFHLVSLSDLLEARDGTRRLPRRSVLLTFDDAYRDFADVAWPILRRHGAPVTLFVPTGYVFDPSAPFWWDWLAVAVARAPQGTTIRLPGGSIQLASPVERRVAYARLRREVKALPHDEAMELVREVAANQLSTPPPHADVLDWPSLRALAADGVTLAPHSRTHPLLARTSRSVAAAEIAGSADDLTREIGPTPPAFAYPSGSVSPHVRDAAEAVGMRVAFTTRRGLNRLGRTDWLLLRRINVGGASSVNALRAQLGTWALVWSRRGIDA